MKEIEISAPTKREAPPTFDEDRENGVMNLSQFIDRMDNFWLIFSSGFYGEGAKQFSFFQKYLESRKEDHEFLVKELRGVNYFGDIEDGDYKENIRLKLFIAYKVIMFLGGNNKDLGLRLN